MDKAYLILENGYVCEGTRFGAQKDVCAELVFTTPMTGYIETLTDPSYHGQIVLQTFPLIGNYGVIPEEFESGGTSLDGYIVHDLCVNPSNFRSSGRLGEFLERQGVAGLCDIDTRALTRMLRERGTMNAAILSQLPENTEEFAQELAKKSLCADVYAVSVKERFVLNEQGSKTVVLWDFGSKKAMARKLASRGCRVVVMPAASTADELLSCKPDGIFLSNGPGDPSVCGEIIEQMSQLCGAGIPTFAICLGHQLLALARGGKTEKLKYGHRGANQPVRETKSGRLFVTSQNHGYTVCSDSLPKCADVSYVNLNDGTVEGLDYTDMPAFSVQFHPEACGGPLDTEFLFSRFVSMLEDK